MAAPLTAVPAETTWPERFGDFAARIAAQPRRSPIVEGLIQPYATHMLVGEPRSGKTLFSQNLAVSVAIGRAVLDRFNVPQPSPVLYCTEEDAAPLVLARMSGFLRGYGVDGCPDTLRVSAGYGVSLDSDEWQRKILDAVAAGDLAAMIIDPLQQFTANVGEGPAKFQPVGRFLRTLANTGCAVVVVHHTTKLPPGQRESRVPAQRVSGGGVLAVMDVPILFERRSERQFLATPDRWKHSATPEPFGFAMEGDGDAIRLVSDATLAQTLDDRVVGFVATNPGATLTAIYEKLKGKRKEDYRDMLNRIAMAGRIRIDGNRFYPALDGEPVEVAA